MARDEWSLRFTCRNSDPFTLTMQKPVATDMGRPRLLQCQSKPDIYGHVDITRQPPVFLLLAVSAMKDLNKYTY